MHDKTPPTIEDTPDLSRGLLAALLHLGTPGRDRLFRSLRPKAMRTLKRELSCGEAR